MTVTFEPCIYCGKAMFDGALIGVMEPDSITGYIEFAVSYAVKCPECGAQGPQRETVEMALNDWNMISREYWGFVEAREEKGKK